MKKIFLTITVLWILAVSLFAQSHLPGVEVGHSHPSTKEYLGSPSIVILEDGTYIASMDKFGAKIDQSGEARTVLLFSSKDKGETWQKLNELKNSYWCNLFTFKGDLYLMGTSDRYGKMIIRKSTDGGKTWTTPVDKNTGIIRDDKEYHTSSVPVVIHNGRIYRAYEDRYPAEEWGINFRALVVSAPVDADLLKASSWTTSNRLRSNPDWGGKAWLEGNVVVGPKGKLYNVLRFEINDHSSGKACIAKVSEYGERIRFNPKKGIVNLPNGSTKFTIRYDKKTKKYYSLTNYITEDFAGVIPNPGGLRNTVGLVTSKDLINWELERIVLHHDDYKMVGFQYIDWQFDGDDLVSLIRTAYPEADGTPADSFHNSNYMMFYRVKDFRKSDKK